MIGTQLGHYRVLDRLGEGGMGVVFRAHDEILQRDVAIKVLQPSTEGDDRARARLLREARMASALQDPRICTVFEVAEERAVTFIVMELVRGRTVAEMLRSGPLELAEVRRLGGEIAGAIAHAHAHGVVHRDLKCANVMVTEGGGVKVLDFGLARRQLDGTAGETQSMTATAGVAGTPAYMAPETLLGRSPDKASDVWALGVVLFEMATGKTPYAGSTWYELSNNVLNGPAPTFPDSTPAALRALIERCLEKDREKRTASADDVHAALMALGEVPARAPGGTIQVPAAAPRPRLARRVLVMAAAGLAVVAVAGVLGRLGLIGIPGASGRVIRSLAVLPLQNMTGDPGQEFFAEGMTDELINTLARLAALRVISRTSTMQYRDTRKAVPEIARELGVDAILEGGVSRGGNRVRVSARLIRGRDDHSLWANEYERQINDVLDLQGDVATAVASQIQVAISPAERSSVTRHRPVNPAAYELVLRGRHLLDAQSVENMRAALDCFQQAARLDPGMASAHAGIANCYYVLSDFEGDPQRYAQLGRQAAARAIRLDESLPDAHISLALVLSAFDYDWAGADREFRRALELNPNSALAHLWYSFEFRCRGDAAHDREHTRLAVALDPINPFTASQPGWVEWGARRYDAALALFHDALRADSTLVQAREGLGLTYEAMHRYDQAVQELSRVATEAPISAFYGSLGHVLGVAGRTKEALAILDTLSHPHPGFTPAASDRMLVLMGLGRRQEALREMVRAADSRATWMFLCRVDPRFDDVRLSPEFQTALAHMHLSDRDVQNLAAANNPNGTSASLPPTQRGPRSGSRDEPLSARWATFRALPDGRPRSRSRRCRAGE